MWVQEEEARGALITSLPRIRRGAHPSGHGALRPQTTQGPVVLRIMAAARAPWSSMLARPSRWGRSPYGSSWSCCYSTRDPWTPLLSATVGGPKAEAGTWNMPWVRDRRRDGDHDYGHWGLESTGTCCPAVAGTPGSTPGSQLLVPVLRQVGLLGTARKIWVSRDG